MKLNMQAISFDDAKNKAIEKLNQYKKSGDFTDLESAVENDNTNTSILFEYLKYLSVNDKEKYLEDGFDDYLAKPINKDELNKIIKKYLNN